MLVWQTWFWFLFFCKRINNHFFTVQLYRAFSTKFIKAGTSIQKISFLNINLYEQIHQRF